MPCQRKWAPKASNKIPVKRVARKRVIMILGDIRVSTKYAGIVLLVENDFWGRKKRNLDLFDYKSGFIEAFFFASACPRQP